VSTLASVDCPSVLVLGILKTLHRVADNLPPSTADEWLVDRQLAELLYSKEYIGCLARIIGQTSDGGQAQQIISLTISLICKTCTEERQKNALVEAGVLASLATRLASFVVAQGFVLPAAENIARDAGSLTNLPQSASSKARLAPTLMAIAVLVEQSKSRAKLFLSSPAILAVFPIPQAEFSPTDVKKAPWGTSTYLSGAAVPRHNLSNAIDTFLPAIPTTSAKPPAENFPPLSSAGAFPKKRSSFQSPPFSTNVPSSDNVSEEDESPLIAWLVYLVRAESGMGRLMASKLLVALFALGLTRKSRASMFCMLLVPLLIKMLDKDYEVIGQAEEADHDMLPLKFRIQAEAPGILATLVMDVQKLQKAAVDCQAIKKLSQLLKETFDPLPGNGAGMWNPERTTSHGFDVLDSEGLRGENAPTPLARYTMKLREGVLQALASIAPFDDDYKKAICDQGVVPYIIDSLKPYPPASSRTESGSNNLNVISGNAASTLLAACGAVRVLTRSVMVLRTSLIDAGVGPPLFALLIHSDVEVQIAATKVVSNLAVDFSPMREAIVQHNVIKSLCEHSHTANARLRLESLWALKHVVLQSSNDIKIRVVQELGADWIKQLISTDPSDIPEGTVVGVLASSRTANGYEHSNINEIKNASPERHKKSAVKRRQQALTDEVVSPIHTVEDDVAIQAELFDLIRNLICGEEAAEMIDYVLKTIGQKDFFEILLDRIRPKTIAGPTLKDTKTMPAASDVIINVLYIIVHIAASLPRFRSVVAAQTNLLRQILTFLNHSSREIRVPCCWIAINLTYTDDELDRAGCRQRAQELHKLGYLTRLMALGEDVDLDVRERAKTAIDLIGAHVRQS
jgi:armadillo repeat-containing protein 8